MQAMEGSPNPLKGKASDHLADQMMADVLKFRGWEIPNLYVMYQAYKMLKEID